MKHSVCLVTAFVCLAMPIHAAQIITPAETTATVDAGATVTFQPVYSVAAPDHGLETGLGMRVHFNANALVFNGVSQAFAYAFQPVGEITPDVANADADPNTSHYFILAWADVTAQWPGVDELPLLLGKLNFTPKPGFAGTTHIRTTATDTADGVAFQSTPMTISVAEVTSALTLTLRGFLQGAYVSAEGLMRDNLRSNALLPLEQPYAAFGYNGTETTTNAQLATTGNNAPVDWVLVELRAKNVPQQPVARLAALLQRDGDVVDASSGNTTLSFANVPAGDYYVALRHRNHLGVMSATPLTLSDSPRSVDFSQATTAVYGKEVRLAQGAVRLLPTGDVNRDNKLIAEGPGNDKNTVLGAVLSSPDNSLGHTNFQWQGYHLTDLNLDGKTLYVGPDNDVNALLGNVLLAPANTTSSTNYILSGSVPQ